MSVIAEPQQNIVKQEPVDPVLIKQEFSTKDLVNGVSEHGESLLPDYGQKLPSQPEVKIIKKKISGYVGFANLPKQWHRKSIQQGFQFNLLCVGKQGLGKSTLINTLFNRNLSSTANDSGKQTDVELELTKKLERIALNDTHAMNEQQQQQQQQQQSSGKTQVEIEAITAELEEKDVKLKLCVIDTPGFGSSIDNTDSWKPILKEIENRYDEYLDSENKINRSVGKLDDPRVHAVLYFIEPTGHSLKPLDLEFCSKVASKCNLIPVIAKSDIMTLEEVSQFKSTILQQFKENNINLFQPPVYETDDDESISATKELINKFPFAVMGSTDLISVDGNGSSNNSNKVRGRQYPWGHLEVDNPEHNDFVYLKNLIIKQHMEELKERTSKVLYEKYRSEKLYKVGIKQDNSVFKEYDPETKQLEEKKLHEAKLNKLENEMKQVFQQKVSEKEKKLQKSEAELFARHKEMKEKLMKQLKALEDKKYHLEMALKSSQSSGANDSSATGSATATSSTPAKKKGFLR